MRFLPLLTVLLIPPAAAQADTVLDAIRAKHWDQADAIAATAADPLARALVLYYRVLTPGAASSVEIAAFMAEHPEWPNGALLSRRLQDALVVDRDIGAVLDVCRKQPPQAVPSLLRCADAAASGGAADTAAAAARRAWIGGITDAPAEAAFVKRWAAQVPPEDQWRRFDRLAWAEGAAPGGPAMRQVARLPAAMRPAAEARLALRRDDATAPALVAALPAAARADPALVLELARWFRRAGQDRDAADVWTGAGVAAERNAPPERRGAFWDERNQLARRMLRSNDAATAYAVVRAPAAGADAAIDAAFLAGWIALRRLGQPETALGHFATLATLSEAAITQARAHYWLGRAHAATERPEAAAAEFLSASRWPTTYYGQLAAMARGDDPVARVAALRDPVWDEAQALAFLTREPVRVALLLAEWGDARRAKPFLARLDSAAAAAADRAMTARLALGLGLPDAAVAIARRAGRDGMMLPGAGWPAAATPPAGGLDPAVVLGLIRQESSFDVEAVSPSGARGLMQLMPATAAGVARKLGLAPDIPALTTDPAVNMRLGTTYLQDLLAQFNHALPLAIAGYNAGPHRVQDWLIASDVLTSGNAEDMIDWIEMIPFNETRNYVQRVIENIVIYRAQAGDTAPHPLERPGLVAASGEPG